MSDSLETVQKYWKEAKSKAKAQVFVPFESKVKKLKARVHRCKAECYKIQEYTRYVSDECAKACQLPYSMLMDKNKSALEVCESRFEAQSKLCMTKSLDDAKACLEGAVQIYKICIRENEDEVQKNFTISEQKFSEIVKSGKEKVRIENNLSKKSVFDEP